MNLAAVVSLDIETITLEAIVRHCYNFLCIWSKVKTLQHGGVSRNPLGEQTHTHTCMQAHMHMHAHTYMSTWARKGLQILWIWRYRAL